MADQSRPKEYVLLKFFLLFGLSYFLGVLLLCMTAEMSRQRVRNKSILLAKMILHCSLLNNWLLFTKQFIAHCILMCKCKLIDRQMNNFAAVSSGGTVPQDF